MTPEEQARFDALERRVAELERRLQPRQWKIPARPVRSTPRWELTLGLHWISWVAAVTVVLALAFFFQYAFENRLIGETGRVVLGAVCGAAAVGCGELLSRRGHRAYANALAAAGISFFYLSIWAAFSLYHLLPQSGALGLMALTTGAAWLLALHHRSAAVALLGAAGGYATPLLLSSEGQPWFVLSYALLLAAGARRWPWSERLSVLGTAALYLSQAPARPFYAAFVLADYALFAASRSLPVFVAAEVLAPIALASIWAPERTGLAAALALSAVGAGLRRHGVAGAFAGFWLAYAIWYGQSGYTPLGLLTGSYILFAAWPFWRRVERLTAIELATLALNAGLYFGASYALLETSYAPYAGLFAVGIAVAQAAGSRLLWASDRRAALLSAGTAWVILVLAAPVQFAGYRVTVVWAAEAAAIVWIGARLAERRAVRAGIGLLGLTVARLAFSDSRLAVDATLINPRFFAFAATAAALWASAWWIRQGRTASAAYIAGHAVLLWGLCLDAVSWAARTASPANFTSVASTAVSVVAGAYAVLLVGGGAARRHAASRLLGIGLIGLVVLKLYLYDVWLLGAFYRMAAFAILGVMLLVMSYLYSRRAGSGPAPREP